MLETWILFFFCVSVAAAAGVGVAAAVAPETAIVAIASVVLHTSNSLALTQIKETERIFFSRNFLGKIRRSGKIEEGLSLRETSCKLLRGMIL